MIGKIVTLQSTDRLEHPIRSILTFITLSITVMQRGLQAATGKNRTPMSWVMTFPLNLSQEKLSRPFNAMTAWKKNESLCLRGDYFQRKKLWNRYPFRSGISTGVVIMNHLLNNKKRSRDFKSQDRFLRFCIFYMPLFETF